MSLFVFLLGAVSSLVVGFILLVNFINNTEEKIQKEYDHTKSLEEPDVQKVHLDDKKVHVQVEAVGSADVPEWLYGIVRANMVFLFKSELDVSASGVFCLDGAVITVVKHNGEQSSPWHKKNPIQVSCPTRNLLHQSSTLLIYCNGAREAESWYYSMTRGASLSLKKDATMDQRAKKEQNYFKFLHAILKNADLYNVPLTASPVPSPTISPSPSSSPTTHSTMYHVPPALVRSASGSTLPSPTTSIIPPTIPPTLYDQVSSNSNSNSNSISNTSGSSNSNSRVHSHLTWLNALLSRMFWTIHDAPDFSAYLTRKFNKKLLKVKKPSILKTVAICNVSFGPNLPMITSAHLDYIGTTGEVVVSGDLVYHGGFTLTVSIGIAIEVMGHSLAVPVMVTARVTGLHGRAVVCIPAPPSCRVWFAFEREPTCEIDVDTAFGNAGKVANIPRIAKIVVNALKTEMLKIIVLPNMEDFQLPKFKGQQGDKGVVDPSSTVKTEPTSTQTPALVPSTSASTSMPGLSSTSTPVPLTSTALAASSAAAATTTATTTATLLTATAATLPTPTPPLLSTTKGISPTTSASQFDHKMIDEALEKLAKKVQDPQHT